MKTYICEICGEKFENGYKFGRHLKTTENLSSREYYDLYIKKEGEGVCGVCGNPTQYDTLGNGYFRFCNGSCAALGSKSQKQKTCFDRYGVSNYAKLDECQDKKKKTCLEKYGVSHYAKLDECQDKKKKTCLEKYGKNNVSQVEEFKEKRVNTFVERFGVDNPWKSEDVKNKIKNTNMEKYGHECSALNDKVIEKKIETLKQKYGVDHYSKTQEYKEQIISTCQDRYGVDNVFQLDSTKEKSKETSIDKYGTNFPSQSEDVQKKIKQTLIKNHGVDNYSKTDEFRELARNLLINDIEQRLLNGEPLGPRIGELERECLNSLADVCNYEIKRQFRMNGFFLDGYISELNLAVEFYEIWHGKPKHSARDTYRENFLKRKSNCKFFIVLEKNWLYNREAIINEFKNEISNTKE